MTSRRAATWHLGVLVAILVAAWGLLFLLDASATERLAREDGPVEYLGALGFLVASVAFLFAALRWRRDPAVPRLVVLALFGLAAVFLLGAGEEISWGQRLLGVETPESVAAVNAQGELTLHNLTPFQGEDAIAHNAFDKAFDLFWGTWAVLIPVAFAFVAVSRRLLTRLMPVLPVWYAALFAVNYGISKVAGRLVRGATEVSLTVHDAVETKEAVFALLFASAAIWLWRQGPVPPWTWRTRSVTTESRPPRSEPTPGRVTGAGSGW